MPRSADPSLTHRRRLLVVEDDLSAVFALRHFFALADYDVDCAAGPAEGLRLLDRGEYEAVVTDLHLLPGRAREGLRIAARARQRNPRACVILLTAATADVTEDEARRAGVDVFHAKPIELSLLTASIDRVLAPHGELPA